MKLKLGNLNVTVSAAGEGMQPWGGPRPAIVHKYRVTVSGGGGRYTTSAWGSISDFGKGERDYKGIGAMVVDELLSAAADPREFAEMVIGETEGKEATKRRAIAKRTCVAAGKFSYDDLERAVNAARDKNLL